VPSCNLTDPSQIVESKLKPEAAYFAPDRH